MRELRTDHQSLFNWAAHEAGHAVAIFVGARQLGLTGDVVVGLKLDREGEGKLANHRGEVIQECRALCDLSDGWMAALKLNDRTTNECRRALAAGEAHLLALLAGPYAELEVGDAKDKSPHAGNAHAYGFTSDLAEADTLSRKMAMIPGSWRRRSWVAMHRDAQNLVKTHIGAIVAIASRLLEDGELSGREAVKMFGRYHRCEEPLLAVA